MAGLWTVGEDWGEDADDVGGWGEHAFDAEDDEDEEGFLEEDDENLEWDEEADLDTVTVDYPELR